MNSSPSDSTLPLTRIDGISFVLMVSLLLIVLTHGLVPASFFGLLVYTLVRLAAKPIEARLSPGWSRLIALVAIATLIVAVSIVSVSALIHQILEADWSALFIRLQTSLSLLRQQLPEQISQAIPEDSTQVIGQLAGLAQDHAAVLSDIGMGGVRAVALCLVTAMIASMLAVEGAGHASHPFAIAMGLRVHRLWTAFRKILLAQAKISLINTLFTAVYLLIALPIAGMKIPHADLLVIVTFFAAFIPVVGNLLSNGAVVLLSLTVSMQLAGLSLLFLLVIHKLEYFLNARIVGKEVNCEAWELLCVMLLGETLFGISGVIAAPILYSWIKSECVALKPSA